jgi:hypothetical protein
MPFFPATGSFTECLAAIVMLASRTRGEGRN